LELKRDSARSGQSDFPEGAIWRSYPSEKGRQWNVPLRGNLSTQETLVDVVEPVAAVLACVAIVRIAWRIVAGIVLLTGNMASYHADGGKEQEE
jgi:hypothetical protein